MRGLVWAFAGPTYHIVGNHMSRLIYKQAPSVTVHPKFCNVDSHRFNFEKIPSAPKEPLNIYHFWFCHKAAAEHSGSDVECYIGDWRIASLRFTVNGILCRHDWKIVDWDIKHQNQIIWQLNYSAISIYNTPCYNTNMDILVMFWLPILFYHEILQKNSRKIAIFMVIFP